MLAFMFDSSLLSHIRYNVIYVQRDILRKHLKYRIPSKALDSKERPRTLGPIAAGSKMLVQNIPLNLGGPGVRPIEQILA